jgi:hypothetical protein
VKPKDVEQALDEEGIAVGAGELEAELLLKAPGAGVTHFHVGEQESRLQPLRDLIDDCCPSSPRTPHAC